MDSFQINLGYCSIVRINYQGYYDGYLIDIEETQSLNPYEIVLQNKTIDLVIDYPLSNPAIFSLSTENEKGFTRLELVEKICKCYDEVYTQDEITDQYGIWGHDINDLILHTAHIRNNIMYVDCDS